MRQLLALLSLLFFAIAPVAESQDPARAVLRTELRATLDVGRTSPFHSVNSLSFDDVDDPQLVTAVAETLFDFGFPNSTTHQFTISVWAYPTGATSTGTHFHAAGSNEFFIQGRSDTGDTFVQFTDEGVATKRWITADGSVPTSAAPALYMLTATFDGTNNADAIKIYVDGVIQVISGKPLDGDISGILNEDMFGSIGAIHTPAQSSQHDIFYVATWDSELLVAELLELAADPLLDLRYDFGDYVSSANNKSFWPVGRKPTPNMGQDLGVQRRNLSVEVDLVDSDRSANIPPN